MAAEILNRRCWFPKCEAPVYESGLCQKHYWQAEAIAGEAPLSEEEIVEKLTEVQRD